MQPRAFRDSLLAAWLLVPAVIVAMAVNVAVCVWFGHALARVTGVEWLKSIAVGLAPMLGGIAARRWKP